MNAKKLLRKSLKWPITYSKQYRQLRNKINQMIQSAKAEYYKTKLRNSKSDVKKSWSVINEILNRKTKDDTRPNPALITPDQFNDHFTAIGPSLSAKIPPSHHSHSFYLPPPIPNCLCFRQISPTETKNIIMMLNDSSPGMTKYPVKLSKQHRTYQPRLSLTSVISHWQLVYSPTPLKLLLLNPYSNQAQIPT